MKSITVEIAIFRCIKYSPLGISRYSVYRSDGESLDAKRTKKASPIVDVTAYFVFSIYGIAVVGPGHDECVYIKEL